jgi:hypothetical protein
MGDSEVLDFGQEGTPTREGLRPRLLTPLADDVLKANEFLLGKETFQNGHLKPRLEPPIVGQSDCRTPGDLRLGSRQVDAKIGPKNQSHDDEQERESPPGRSESSLHPTFTAIFGMIVHRTRI